ncbi:MAG TPA: iron ABC transporter substrate-binding protein [Spirillospora sp.]|nr:iron ABC transporter substrate-binding protein [Spirillospora sp.]
MRIVVYLSLVLMLLGVSFAPVAAQDEVLTVYSGRGESLIGPILQRFTQDTGIQVQVLYGDTASVANQILEEGDNSPADVYIAQDAGALGALAKAGRLAVLPNDIMERVENPTYKSPDNLWVGLSARARVLVYNPDSLAAAGLELPASMLDLTNPEWRGLVGWAPTNASFQAHITAMRVLLGDETAQEWLAGMVANEAVAYSGNSQVVEAVINGEVPVGLVNHYYLHRFLAEDPTITTTNYHFPDGDIGALVNIAGAGVLNTSDQPGLAQRLILYLLGKDAQTYFAVETYEYPLVAGVEPSGELTPLSAIEVPDIDLSNLDDLETTLEMIEASGALDR